jgi:hypothetical protein
LRSSFTLVELAEGAGLKTLVVTFVLLFVNFLFQCERSSYRRRSSAVALTNSRATFEGDLGIHLLLPLGNYQPDIRWQRCKGRLVFLAQDRGGSALTTVSIANLTAQSLLDLAEQTHRAWPRWRLAGPV